MVKKAAAKAAEAAQAPPPAAPPSAAAPPAAPKQASVPGAAAKSSPAKAAAKPQAAPAAPAAAEPAAPAPAPKAKSASGAKAPAAGKAAPKAEGPPPPAAPAAPAPPVPKGGGATAKGGGATVKGGGAPAKGGGASAKGGGAPPPAAPAAGAAAAPAAKAGGASTGGAKAGAKAGGKAKAAPAPTPPPPVEEPEEAQDGADDAEGKKKKSRRGGRKKGEEGAEGPAAGSAPGAGAGGPTPEEVAAKALEVAAKKANQVAEQRADADPIVVSLRARWTEVDAAATAARTAAAGASSGAATTAIKGPRADLEAFVAELDKQMAAKKAALPRKMFPSYKLALELSELRALKEVEMAKDMEKKIEEAEVAEAHKAALDKMTALKARAEKALEALSAVGKPPPSAPKAAASSTLGGPAASSAGPSPGGGKGAPSAASASASAGALRPDQEERILSRLRERAAARGEGAPDVNGAKLHTRTIELPVEVTRALVLPPQRFITRYEREFNVHVEGVRPPKGSGKGKGPPPASGTVPKELLVAGHTSEEVEKCAAVLRALDFSGSQTREVDRAVRIRDLENDFNVLSFKNGSQLTLYGPRAKVDAAFASATAAAKKAESDKPITEVINMDAEKVKAMTAGRERSMLNTWREANLNVQIRVPVPQAGEEAATTSKILITAKTQAEVDETKKKVEDWAKSTLSEFMACDTSKLYEPKPVFKVGDAVEVQWNRGWAKATIEAEPEGDDGNYTVVWANAKEDDEPYKTDARQIRLQGASTDATPRRFRELCNSSSVTVVRKDGGLQLVGKKQDLATLKAAIQDLIKKASYEPESVELSAYEQQRVFSRECCAEIEKKSGADVRRQDWNLIIVGDPEQVAKAKAEIDEVIRKQGTVEWLEITEDVAKSLKAASGAKIKDLENKHYVSLSIKGTNVTIVGGAAPVQAAKREIEMFTQRIEKEQGERVTRELRLDQRDIRKVIGTKGAQVKLLRTTYNVNVQIHDETSTVELTGVEEDVLKAEKAIQELLEKEEDKVPVAAPKPKKKAEEYKGSADDFPTLGGEAEGAAAEAGATGAPAAAAPKWAAPKAWGAPKAGAPKAPTGPAEANQANFPTLGKAAGKSAAARDNGKAAAAAATDEDENGAGEEEEEPQRSKEEADEEEERPAAEEEDEEESPDKEDEGRGGETKWADHEEEEEDPGVKDEEEEDKWEGRADEEEEEAAGENGGRDDEAEEEEDAGAAAEEEEEEAEEHRGQEEEAEEERPPPPAARGAASPPAATRSAEEDASPPTKAKAQVPTEEFKSKEDDFPALGGGGPAPKAKWGAKASVWGTKPQD